MCNKIRGAKIQHLFCLYIIILYNNPYKNRANVLNSLNYNAILSLHARKTKNMAYLKFMLH